MTYAVQGKHGKETNRLYEEDKSIHDWYRFVMSYPPHLVRYYIKEFNLKKTHKILDPFSGTGTTLVEAKKAGFPSEGIEANPVVYMAAKTKINWQIDTDELISAARIIANETRKELVKLGANYRELSYEQSKLIIRGSISPVPLHKMLILKEIIDSFNQHCGYDFYRTALAKQAVFNCSNLRFGPEVGVSKKKKLDVDVIKLWLNQVEDMAHEVSLYKDRSHVKAEAHFGDSREFENLISPNSVDAVITSPPYPNEKDYTRTTRLESVLLGFINDKQDLRIHKNRLLRSNTRNIYKGDSDGSWIKNNNRVADLSRKIERKRISLGKNSGFEKLYHRVVELYFGGIARHLEQLKPKLRNGAKLAYVLGDQASFFRIPIRTGKIFSEIAEQNGYKVKRIDLFRTRLSTVTKQQLKEEVVLLEWWKS